MTKPVFLGFSTLFLIVGIIFLVFGIIFLRKDQSTIMDTGAGVTSIMSAGLLFVLVVITLLMAFNLIGSK